jgi:heterodisulfide reductase subunit C
MHYLSQIIFLILLLITSWFIYRSIRRIRRNILIGKPENRSDHPGKRIKRTLLVAFGQKKMFKKPLPALLHLFVYLGFIIVNIEILEIILDGMLGTHRLFAPVLTILYPSLINIFEFFAVAVIISCATFLIRRNIIRVNRFKGEEMTQWPLLDANIILSAEIFLMCAFLSMNAADMVLQSRGVENYSATGSFFFSGFITDLFNGLENNQLIFIERFTWWAHIIGVFAFANYVFYNSKHLHIFISFPNTYFSNLEPAGKFTNMTEVTKEVKLMLNLPVENQTADNANQPVGRFGAKDVQDLTWKNLMDAYSCTECGRCTAACPANITGKKLSPRKIMMDTRDRAEEIGKTLEKNGKDFTDGKSLLGDYITVEEIMACTTCNACVEACPVTIDPLNIIMQLRRYKIMEESQAPASWNMMFSNIENNFAPWKFSPADRFKWAEKLKDV